MKLALRMISPTEESLWKHGHLVTVAQKAKDQVVVFRPAHIPIPDGFEDGGANHQGWMRDGAFNKGVLDDGSV